MRAATRVSVEIGTPEGTIDRFEAEAAGLRPPPEVLRAELDRLAADLEEHFTHAESQLLPALSGGSPGA